VEFCLSVRAGNITKFYKRSSSVDDPVIDTVDPVTDAVFTTLGSICSACAVVTGNLTSRATLRSIVIMGSLTNLCEQHSMVSHAKIAVFIYLIHVQQLWLTVLSTVQTRQEGGALFYG